MKVSVDAERCQGHLRCVLYAEQIFEVDDQGHAFVAGDAVPPTSEEAVKRAELNCPERAISVED